MQSFQWVSSISHLRVGQLFCVLLFAPMALNAGCGNGSNETKRSEAIGGNGGNSRGGNLSTVVNSSGLGGNTVSNGGNAGTAESPSVTHLSGTETVGSLSTTDATQLCDDTYAYFGKALSQSDLCKWAGLTHGVSSLASSDATLQESCKTQENSCLQAGAVVAKCDTIPADCDVTVSVFSACITAQAQAFNEAVNGLPGCATVALSDLPGVWAYGTADLPATCTAITEKCPTFNLPTPRPPNANSGSGGQSGTGGTTASFGGNTGIGGSTHSVGSGGSTNGGGIAAAGTATVIDGLPGDIAKAAGTPFVAAHAMTRALFASYTGPLFKALRDSDQQEKDIGIVSSTKLVDMTLLDSFCSGTTCKVTTLFDQSGNGNDMWRGDVATNAPMDNGEAPRLCDPIAIDYQQLSNGSRLPIAVETGAMWKSKAQCLRNRDKTKNMPVNASPQTTYAVFHSKYVNGNCCFNYGNTGKRIHYTGPGTLSALNFSKIEFWSKGSGTGPWVMMDWEQGVYAGNTAKCGSGAAPSADCTATGENPNPTITFDVVTALEKHDGTKHWQMKAGNAKAGNLAVSVDLPTLPKGYSPLKQEGGLGLGEGGAGDPNGTGGFSEGAVMAAETTDAVDNAIQKSIVSVYGK
jgi:hypothetical protein